MPLKKPYVRNAGCVLTPVYVPGESYSFIVNGAYFSDPNANLWDLQLRDADDNIIKQGFASLNLVFPFGASPLYMVYATYPFPYGVANGYYSLVIWNIAESRVILRSNPILVETEVTDNTMLVEYAHDGPLYGIPYDLMTGPAYQNVFSQRIRLPLAQIEERFEQEKTTYRNVTDRRLRTLKSYRDNNIKIEARGFDDFANEALTAILDHKYIQIDGLAVEPKSAISTTFNQLSNVNKSTFEVYANNPEMQHGIFAGYGDILILCGDSNYNPDLLIEP